MVVLLSLLVSEAGACSFAGPDVLEIEEDLQDTEAPQIGTAESVSIKRGVGPTKEKGGWSASSCDDLGTISIVLTDPIDEDVEDVGYRIEKVDGDLPTDLDLPDDLWIGPELFFVWIDGAEDDQDAFDFTLEITPIDRAGNEGEPIEVRLEDDGVPAESASCSSVPGTPAWWCLPLALLGVRRR